MASGQVVRDGTLGPAGAVAKHGNVLPISATDGTLRGGNLFHSFSSFNLDQNEVASFNGPTSVHYVLARVTGGSPSQINGEIRCTISNANLVLINPAGVNFGPDATLNVQGSFAVSTADDIKLGSNGKFSAQSPGPSVLSSAHPSAFGFLARRPAPVSFTGAGDNSGLSVPPGKNLSIAAGDITASSFALHADGGSLILASIGSPGAVNLDPANPANTFTLAPPRAGGELSLSHSMFNGLKVAAQGQRIVLRDGARIFSSTDGAGKGILRIQCDRLFAHGGNEFGQASGIFGFTDRSQGKQNADVQVHASLIELTEGGTIAAGSLSSGRGGDVRADARTIIADGDFHGSVSSISTASIFLGNDQIAPADCGNLRVQADAIRLTNGGEITSTTFSRGNAGNITVSANHIYAAGINSTGRTLSGIVADSQKTSGNAGHVRLESDTIVLRQGGLISSNTHDQAHGGHVQVKTLSLKISGEVRLSDRDHNISDSGVFTDSFSANGGTAGAIQIRADHIRLTRGGKIRSDTEGANDGGSIQIHALSLICDGEDSDGTFSGVTAAARKGSHGNAGDIIVHARTIRLTQGAQLSGTTFGTGNGGNVSVDAQRLFASGENATGDSGIITNTQLPGRGGDGGTIRVRAQVIRLFDGAEISAITLGLGRAGSTNVRSEVILARGENADHSGSGIYANTDAPGRGGDAGDVHVSAGTIRLIDGGAIGALSLGKGRGGNISVQADSLMASGINSRPGPGGLIASSFNNRRAGSSGSIRIDAGAISIANQAAIESRTSGSGNAGSIDIFTSRSFTLDRAARVDVTAGQSAGGNIRIESGAALTLRNASISAQAKLNGGNIRIIAPQPFTLIDTPVAANAESGDGGNLFIGNSNMTLTNQSGLTAHSNAGNGGRIFVLADEFRTNGNSIDATGGRQNGTVNIVSSSIFKGLMKLEAKLDLKVEIFNDCAQRFAPAEAEDPDLRFVNSKGPGSFVNTGKGGTIVEPGGFAPAFRLQATPPASRDAP